jgi:hypothetical protein
METIGSGEIVQNILHIFILVIVLRTFFILGIIFAIITIKTIPSQKSLFGYDLGNRISPHIAIEVIFNNFLLPKSKPFRLKEV